MPETTGNGAAAPHIDETWFGISKTARWRRASLINGGNSQVLDIPTVVRFVTICGAFCGEVISAGSNRYESRRLLGPVPGRFLGKW